MAQWTDLLDSGAHLAIVEAERFRGATAPNPPVGAAGWDEAGNLLGVAAHTRAGLPHAEICLIRLLEERGVLNRLATVFVTLEPCNHVGRTGPCTDALSRTPVKDVWFGVVDPNQHVAGGGAERLNRHGVHAQQVPSGGIRDSCIRLIAPFHKWSRSGLPFVTLKTAHRREEQDLWAAMIPPQGVRTFTSESSLQTAHELRRRADAVLTGSGTVMADLPRFTVRRVDDHVSTKRRLVVLDRRGRVPAQWWTRAKALGFERMDAATPQDALKKLGDSGCLEVLVEAGPTLSRQMLELGLCDEWVKVSSGGGQPDELEVQDVHRHY